MIKKVKKEKSSTREAQVRDLDKNDGLIYNYIYKQERYINIFQEGSQTEAEPQKPLEK